MMFNECGISSRRRLMPYRLLGLMAAFDVELPPNSTGTQVETVAGVGGVKARQVAAIGDAVTPAQLLVVSSRGSAQVEGGVAAGAALAGNPLLIAGQDGTLIRNLATAGAAILGALSSAGALLVSHPGDWSINNTPAAATAATITRAAGGAGVRHVATSISATVATIGTAQAVALVLVLRDGATGAGTILWSKQVVLPVNAVWEVNISGLNIVGTAATAMTLEFVANNVAASFSSVSLTGHDTPAA